MDHQSSDSSLASSISRSWRNQSKEIARYWELYGGWRALAASPYAHLSVVFGIVTQCRHSKAFDPAAATLSVIPNVLGFTVGALAIILAFSSSDFFTYLIDGGKEKSLFMKTVANFVHFIVVQIFSILLAILCSAHPSNILKILTSIILTYAILTTLTTVIQLFQMATVFNASRQLKAPEDGE